MADPEIKRLREAVDRNTEMLGLAVIVRDYPRCRCGALATVDVCGGAARGCSFGHACDPCGAIEKKRLDATGGPPVRTSRSHARRAGAALRCPARPRVTAMAFTPPSHSQDVHNCFVPDEEFHTLRLGEQVGLENEMAKAGFQCGTWQADGRYEPVAGGYHMTFRRVDR